MFSFFKKNKRHVNLDLGVLKADMHSHLIPGIDDGAKDVADTALLLQGLKDLGYEKIVTTPHIMSDFYPNTAETIAAGFTRLQEVGASIPGSPLLHVAAEYYLDEEFEKLLQQNVPLLTISKNLVLVEFSFISPPLNLKEQLFELQVKGYQPVLAHPERYLYFAKKKTELDDLKSMGCLFQLNLLSLTGYYGKPVQQLAHYLADKQFIDLLGTDMHHARHLDTLKNSGYIQDTVNQLLDSGKILNTQI